MDFKTRLNTLFSQLEFTNIAVSRLGRLDPSLISRFRTGARTPTIGSRQLERLCRGIALLALENGKEELLGDICGAPYKNPDQLRQELERWLGDGGALLRPHRFSGKSSVFKNHQMNAFSEKMEALMTAFDIQNIRLARGLHVDASLISKFKTGMRIPAADSWFPRRFCQWMSEKILALPPDGYGEKLKALIGEPVLRPGQTLQERLLEWITSNPEDGENQIVDSLLDKLDTYRPMPEISLKLPNASAPHLSPGDSRSYFGKAGLRRAVTRLLSAAAAGEEPRSLYLYSDQPLDWLSEDKEFAKQWSALMTLVLKRGSRVHIIHNITRDISEMLDAIKKWLPLYMTGLIHAYYYPGDTRSRFCKTMFIVRGIACVEASFVAGTEDFADYRFIAEKDGVDYHFGQFSALLGKSERLIDTFSLGNPREYSSCLQALGRLGGHSKHLRDTLSMATMPGDLFEQIIARCGLDGARGKTARRYRQVTLDVFNDGLSGGSITELLTLAECGDNIKIDLPMENLFYKAEEYALHLKNIISLLKAHPSYKLCPLPQLPFESIMISVWNNQKALLLRTDEPAAALLFDNRPMGYAISKYLETLQQKAMAGRYHREKVISGLKKYLNESPL